MKSTAKIESVKVMEGEEEKAAKNGGEESCLTGKMEKCLKNSQGENEQRRDREDKRKKKEKREIEEI